MSENEEMSMAQKLEVLRQVTAYGVGSGYEPNGERGPVVIEVPEFAPARSTITEIHSGSPVSSAEFDEPIVQQAGGDGGGGDHMWKASSAGESDAEVPVPLYNVLGGIVVVQGTRFEVEDVDELECAAEGFICLKVIRDSDSRALSEEEGEEPEIVFEVDEPVSDYAGEYTILAELFEISTPAEDPEDPPIITQGFNQCRNDEICSHELMLVENGEFKLMPFQTNSRNSYDPPEPEPEPEP